MPIVAGLQSTSPVTGSSGSDLVHLPPRPIERGRPRPGTPQSRLTSAVAALAAGRAGTSGVLCGLSGAAAAGDSGAICRPQTAVTCGQITGRVTRGRRPPAPRLCKHGRFFSVAFRRGAPLHRDACACTAGKFPSATKSNVPEVYRDTFLYLVFLF